MARKRVKLRKKDDGHKPNAGESDKLLELPDFILHHILSLLPTIDVVRLSLLSKRWRRIWYSLPALNFSDSSCAKPTNFCKNVGKCMRLRKADLVSGQNTAITSFKLATSFSWRWSTIDGWLSLVSHSKLKELDISISSRPKKWYRVPHDLLRIRSLLYIRLVGVEVKGLEFSISLPSLSSFSLEKVNMDDQVLRNLISGCASLERLCVHSCRGLSKPKVSSSRLKFLEIGHSGKGEKFQIETPNLESFVCHELPASLESNLSLSRTIRKLLFINSNFEDRWLEDLIFTLPQLERLALRNCPNIKHVNIHGKNLKGFTFDGNGDCGRAGATVFSPNLVYISYRGYLQSNILTSSKNLSEAHVRLYKPQNCCKEWFTNLVKFLSNLNCSERLNLDVHSEQVISTLSMFLFPIS